MTNSQLTIKGPAAGLIVIALGAVEELGGGDQTKGYQLTLAIVVVSGLLQVVFGLLKSGKLGDFFPSSVIHGMLAAIGIIIMSKQIHIAMGVVPEGKEPFSLIEEIPSSFANMNPEVAIIGLISMLVLFLHPLIKNRVLNRIPAPLLVLAVAIPLGFYFDLSHEHDYDLGSLHFHINPAQLLVALPSDFFESIVDGTSLPDFSQIMSPVSIKYIFMFAMVGSVESMLSAKAIDTLDPQHRKSNMNRDLIAVGIGNTLAGFIGGLPMISEIVRSSANINNGGKTKMSNFFHGLFLFIFALLAATLIQKIPTAALSAMLVYTGFKLASPKEFIKVKEIGYDQLLLFVVTLVVTLLTDLLIGVAAGIVLKVALHLMNGASWKDLFAVRYFVNDTNGEKVFKLKGITAFTNYLGFKALLDKENRNTTVQLDFKNVKLVDHTFIENLHHMQNEFIQSGGRMMLTGFEKHNFQSLHPLAARKLIINPFIKGNDDTMSKRELMFSGIAQKNGLNFERTASLSLVRPYLSSFAIFKIFTDARHFIIGSKKYYDLLICDIEYKSVGDFSVEKKEATLAIIQKLDGVILPEFYVQPFTPIMDLSSKYDFEKISLANVQSFDVYGKVQADLDAFFTPELVTLIKNSDYTVVSKRGSVLVTRDLNKLNREVSVLKLIDFIEKFNTIVAKK